MSLIVDCKKCGKTEGMPVNDTMICLYCGSRCEQWREIVEDPPEIKKEEEHDSETVFKINP